MQMDCETCSNQFASLHACLNASYKTAACSQVIYKPCSYKLASAAGKSLYTDPPTSKVFMQLSSCLQLFTYSVLCSRGFRGAVPPPFLKYIKTAKFLHLVPILLFTKYSSLHPPMGRTHHTPYFIYAPIKLTSFYKSYQIFCLKTL